jgi:hypothetical protein
MIFDRKKLARLSERKTKFCLLKPASLPRFLNVTLIQDLVVS